MQKFAVGPDAHGRIKSGTWWSSDQPQSIFSPFSHIFHTYKYMYITYKYAKYMASDLCTLHET